MSVNADEITAFPRLSEAQIAQLKSLGRIEEHPNGTVLFDQGDRVFDFYVVLQGAVEICYAGDTGLTRVTVHGPGQFTGDTDMLSERAAVVQARTMGDTTVLAISPATLKRIIVEQSKLSDLILSGFVMRRSLLIEKGYTGVKIIGSRFSSDTHRLKEFFARNRLPFTWIDVERDTQAAHLLEQFHITPEETPVTIYRNIHVLKNPSNEQLAQCMGLRVSSTETVFDVAVVGAGPSGLAASVYAASEGLKVITFDAAAPGGQAGTSSKIENYLGFPTGISGAELASRAYTQAQKFGALISIPHQARSLACEGASYAIGLNDGQVFRSRTIVVASGAEYRKLAVPRAPLFESRGIFYGATQMEAQMCINAEVIVVGGGNSAGQGTVFLAESARKVHLMIRGGDLEKGMSKYLVRRIEDAPNIVFHPYTEVQAIHGEDSIEAVTIIDNRTQALTTLPVSYIFVFIGARPNTDWLNGHIALDAKGFVRTGHDLDDTDLSSADWRLKRAPSLLETNRQGIFATGDVRAGSTKRVASAVGEGAMAVQYIHTFLSRSG